MKIAIDIPGFQVFKLLSQNVKINRGGRVQIVFVLVSQSLLFGSQDSIEGILVSSTPSMSRRLAKGALTTIDRMTTQGRFKEEMISRAKEVFPEPELPAMPIMLVSVHGGE